MFSEYASRFLAQSQTRMSAIREGRLNNPHNPAPLFHSAADFMPPDEEHEQEVQDFYALKSSRRHFGAYASSNATVQEEDDEDDGDYSGGSTQELRQSGGKGKSRLSVLGNTNNIKSSWRASRSPGSSLVRPASRASSVESDGTEKGGKGKGRMVDIGLDDSVRLGMMPEGIDHSDMVESAVQRPFGGYERRPLLEDDDDDGADRPPRDICIQMPSDDDDEDEEPAFQQFRRPPPPKSNLPDKKPETTFMPRLSSPTQQRGPHMSIIPQQVAYPPLEPPSHDAIWGTLYMVLMTCLFTTSFVVWLHTEELKLGGLDTVYRTIQSSIHLLTVDTLLAIGVSLVWMYLLRAFVKPLLFLILGAVPIILVALSMYPLIMSYRGKWEGDAPQDKAMRWGSIFPAIMAAFWVFFAWRGKNALGRAIGIIQLACKILGENAALVLLSFGTLGAICVFTWVWVAMFTRMFWMGNYIVGGVPLWHLDTKMMMLATYYIMMYLWTLGICSNIQRATSAATVSQWYFHRHQIPKASSKDIMQAAFTHSTTTLFGTICFSSLVALLVRVPLMVAPRRIAAFIHMFCYSFITSPVASLTNPLTLTYAAIHSQPLITSSRAVAGMRFIDTAGYGTGKHPRTAYKFSKMLLTATRGITALSMGIGAWVTTARDINGGSAYGYIVGMIAGAIGWAVLGATEGCLSNIVDACLVCVGSEGPNGGHCREAQMVFGG